MRYCELMKQQHGFIQLPVIIGFVAGVLVLALGYVGVTQYQKYQAHKAAQEIAVQTQMDSQKQALEDAQAEIEKLKQGAATSTTLRPMAATPNKRHRRLQRRK